MLVAFSNNPIVFHYSTIVSDIHKDGVS
ncbi:hypothetical protein LCGC14_2221430, partial [marine sediment metagenome]